MSSSNTERYKEYQGEIRQECKERLAEYVETHLEKSKGKQYCCPICGSGTGKHRTGALTLIPNSTTGWKCFSCNNGGNIFNLHGLINNLDCKNDFPRILHEVADELGIKVMSYDEFIQQDRKTERKEVKKMNGRNDEVEEQVKLSMIKNDIVVSQQSSDRYTYLVNTRGISDTVQERFGIGFISNWCTVNARMEADKFGLPVELYKCSPRCIIPTSDSSYLARDVRPNSVLTENQKGYTKIKMGATHTFNLNALTKNNVVVLTEGEITALSSIQVGFEAIALGTTSRIQEFLENEYYATVGNVTKNDRPVLILCLDSDEAGIKALNKAMELCKKHSIPYIKPSKTFYKNGNNTFGDLNDILLYNHEELRERLQREYTRALNYDFTRLATTTEKEELRSDVPEFVDAIYNQLTGKYRYVVDASRLATYIGNHEVFRFNEQDNAFVWYMYDTKQGIYVQITDETMEMIVQNYIELFDENIVKSRTVSEVVKILKRKSKFRAKHLMNENENIIVMNNGVLHLDTMELLPMTHEYLATIKVDMDYTEKEKSTPTWDKFLKEFTCGDKQMQKFLMQWIGLSISNVCGYHYKKALMMFGKKDTAKSTIRNVINRVLGAKNISSSSIEQLEERFGMASVFNRRIVGSADMRCEELKDVAVFKALTGSDLVQVERKGQDSYEYQYRGVMWFATNHLPEISPKHQEEFYERLILFPCMNVISEQNKDKNLEEKLYSERSAFLSKCLQALRETITNNYEFNIPDKCKETLEQYRIMNNPIEMFLSECTEERTKEDDYKDECTTRTVYEAFKTYCKIYGFFAVNVIQFRKLLVRNFGTTMDNIEKRTSQNTYYRFKLTERAIKDLLSPVEVKVA